jgi:hypothetical protein
VNGYLCTALDSTGTTCTTWVASAGLLPALSISDAFTIAACFLGAWALAYTFRYIARMIIR